MKLNYKKELGHTGLNQTWGYIREDFLDEWNGQEKVKRINEMVWNSPIVGAMRMAIEMPIRGISWNVVSELGEEDERVDLINESFDNMSHSWNDHIIDALLCVFYGWSMFTINYEKVGDKVLWRKLKMLGHDTLQRWLITDEGSLEGVQQWPHLWAEPIPIERMIIYRFRKTKNNPEGESLLRNAWIPWYYVKNLQNIEAIGIERNLAGLPTITPPVGADMEENGTDLSKAQEIVRNVRVDEQHGVVLPPPKGEGEHEKWHFELLSANNQGKVADTDMVISRYEKRMLMSALSQFLMLGQDSVGAMATFEGGTDFFTMAINAISDIIAETFTKYAIERLLVLNGYDPSGITLEHTPAGSMGVDIVGQFLQQTSQFITWTPDDEIWLRGYVKMPEKTVEEIEAEQVEQNEKALEKQKRFMAQKSAIKPEDSEDGVEKFESRPSIDRKLHKFERRWRDKMLAAFKEQEDEWLKEAKRQKRLKDITG